MNTYFEVGVRYDKTMENGAVRKVTENYLVEAISFTEAEKRATEEMEAYISGELRVVTEKITNIAEVVTADDASADKFYKVKHSFIIIDEKTAKEKKLAQYIIIQASSVDDARDRYKQHIKGWLVDVVLEAVSETKYIDYFPYMPGIGTLCLGDNPMQWRDIKETKLETRAYFVHQYWPNNKRFVFVAEYNAEKDEWRPWSDIEVAGMPLDKFQREQITHVMPVLYPVLLVPQNKMEPINFTDDE